MHIARLALEDFRNYEREEVELVAGLNLVVGPNAHGKTNLLEAVHFIGGLGSPRGPDAAVIGDGAERAILHAQVVRGTRSAEIALELRAGRRARALVNGTAVPTARALSELIACVFFGPDDLLLVKGSPDRRRRFLDDLVVKLRPARGDVRREWERVLRQRNALLKSSPRERGDAHDPGGALRVWNDTFCRAGAAVAAARLAGLASLVPYARKRYEAIAGRGSIELKYVSEWLDESVARAAIDNPEGIDEARLNEVLLEKTAASLGREIERGVSLVGPQRDDVAVGLASSGGATVLDARNFASQGDQRSAALALKLGEYDLLTETLGEEPILLLDDVFSELDPDRRRWLADTVRGGGQTLLSSAEPEVVELAPSDVVIRVNEGRIDAGR
ncbi:MAG: DNA replication/repair protein RecF [Actinomycetota bacterium]